MKLQEFKDTKEGKIANGLTVTVGILFVGYAVVAFIGATLLRELIGMGIIFTIGFVAVLYFLLLPKEKDISKRVIYIVASIICVCSIIITIVYAFIGSGDSRYFPLITLPVAIIGILGTVFTILAIRELKKKE
ncbi:MAG: hypothetical protein H7641_06195 [Candidatus Heimdallarchaeota archaeon]|nr:hypothetical protein [Candidatus Heimdallarchaeota archaeon]MCK4877151.1 hypothetical protein [Candidatus Heimdallarchaeota archaeon]